MGKRPYYIIYVTKDCDGYESWIEYIGSNWKAAYARFLSLIESIKQEYFYDEGVDQEHIFVNFNPATQPLEINREIYAGINDDDCCWMSIYMKCLPTGQFAIPMHEERYRRDNPNAKY